MVLGFQPTIPIGMLFSLCLWARHLAEHAGGVTGHASSKGLLTPDDCAQVLHMCVLCCACADGVLR